jgi:two-component system OmpR family response regulator
VDALAEAKPVEERIVRGDLELDLKCFSATWKGRRVELTLTEFWIVHSLARHPGRQNRDQLMRDAELVVDDATVTSHVKRVRAKSSPWIRPRRHRSPRPRLSLEGFTGRGPSLDP